MTKAEDDDELVDEDVCIRDLMRKFNFTEREACAWLEWVVRTGKVTPAGDFTEADRPHWKCWRNLN